MQHEIVLKQITNPALREIAKQLLHGLDALNTGPVNALTIQRVAVQNTACKHVLQAIGLDLIVRQRLPLAVTNGATSRLSALEPVLEVTPTAPRKKKAAA